MFIVIDASVWVARLVSGDVFHEPVKVWMNERLEAGDIFLSPSLLLPEVGGAIGRRTTPALGLKAVEAIQSLPGLQLVEMEVTLVHEAAHLAAKLGLRGADSMYVAVAVRLDLPLFTLDIDQKEKAGKRVKVIAL